MSRDADIESRMIGFLESLDHVSPMDGHVDQPEGVKIADYLFFDGRAVVEMKTLKTEPNAKILSQAAEVMASEEFPLLFGSFDLESAIKATPGGQEIINTIFSNATKHIEQICRNARDQISSTKKLQGLDPDTPGILLVLNDTVSSIPFARLVDRFSLRLSGDGKNPSRFSDIDFIILIQTTYRLDVAGGKVLPVIIISNDVNAYRHHKIEADITHFLASWAWYQGHRFATAPDPAGLRFVLDQQPKESVRSNQELVAARYRAARYMEDFTESQLIEHGVKVVERMLSVALKAKKRPSETDSMIYMTQFAELLEESNLRVFDLNKILRRLKVAE